MIFTETKLKGAYIIELELIEDNRGFFCRSFCINEFNEYDLNIKIVQCNISYNKQKGTIRGMHFQIPPYQEGKLVQCTKGAIYDVIIDLRPDSSTYKEWFSIELNSNTYQLLYIPEGFAHGFQTLEDNTEVFYQMNQFYHPESSSGVRWDDSAFGVEWPLENPIISEKDMSYQLYKLNHNKKMK